MCAKRIAISIGVGLFFAICAAPALFALLQYVADTKRAASDNCTTLNRLARDHTDSLNVALYRPWCAK